MTTPEIVGCAIGVLGTLGTFAAWIESRAEKRLTRLKDEITQVVELKIGEFSAKIKDDRYNDMKEQNRQLMERIEKLK